jgi:hypothetical protein
MARAAARVAPGPVPRRFVLAVTDGGVHVITRRGEVAAWDRSTLQVLAETSRRGVELLLQPPGDRPAVECVGARNATTDAVVAELLRRR